MALETRKNSNNKYYYEKRRVGGRVVSEYTGKGVIAEYAAIRQELQVEQAEEERQERTRMIEELDKLFQPLEDLTQLIAALTKATYLVNGYHNHKGQWRLKRGSHSGN